MKGTLPHVLLGDVLASIRAGVSIDGEVRELKDGEHGILTLSAVANGRFCPTAFKAVIANGRRLGPSVSAGTLLMSRSNTEELVGTCAYVERDYPRLLLPDLLWEIRVRADVPVIPRWLHAVLATRAMRRALVRSASGTSGSMKKISMARLRRVAIPAPALVQQRRAVAWLDQADAMLLRLERLREAKRRLKRALLQLLRMRSRTWRGHVLSDLVAPVTRRNRGSSSRVLTASGEHGLVDQRLYFNKSIAGASLDDYCLLQRGEFAYNRSAMKAYPFGAVKRLEDHDDGVVSTLYICFRLTSAMVTGDYLALVFETGTLDRQLRSIAHVGGRAHGLLNVTRDDFFAITVPTPSTDEQAVFVRAAAALDRDISLLDRLIAAHRQLKRGLMQQLLTGEIAGA